MKVPLSLFLQFVLLLTCSYVWFYKEVSDYFSDEKLVKMELHRIEKSLEQKEFEKQVVASQYDMFKIQTMAMLDGNESIKRSGLVYQNLKSALRAPASIKPLDMTDLRVEELRTAFREKNYSKSISLGEGLMKQKSLLVVKPEVLFFLSESYFLTQQYENAISRINELVRLYPEHIMTGYALLRLAQVSEKAEQTNEAEAIYKVIISQFSDKNLEKEAKRALASLNE